MTRGILIDPNTETVTEVNFSLEGDEINHLISFKGEPRLIQAMGFDMGHTLYVDDEGLLVEGNPIVGFNGSEVQLAGKLLIVGNPDKNGDTTDCLIAVERIIPLIRWTTLESTGEWNDDSSESQEAGFFVINGPTPIFREREKPNAC